MIQIHILRISPDGLFLEFNVECPINYKFNLLEITRYNPVTKLDETAVDLTIALRKSSNIEILRLATNIFGTDVTLYKVKFGAIKDITLETEEVIGYCSNINFVYSTMLDLVMQLTSTCISKSDYEALDRNHMILYAHQEAMRLGRILDAKFFYNVMWNQFTTCGGSARQLNVNTSNCNCT